MSKKILIEKTSKEIKLKKVKASGIFALGFVVGFILLLALPPIAAIVGTGVICVSGIPLIQVGIEEWWEHG